MSWIILIQIVSGYCFFVRTLDNFARELEISASMLTKFGTAYSVWVILGVKILSLSSSSLACWILVPTLLPFVIKAFRVWWWKKNLAKQFYLFINEIVLNMHSGMSLRQSMRMILPQTHPRFRKRLEKLTEFVVFSPHISPKTFLPEEFELISVLKKIDQETHSGLQHIENYRRKLKITLDFRHRSGQILGQIRLQAIILSVLYAILLAYSIQQRSFFEYLELTFLSIGLFMFGLLWIFWAGRRIKWKT